MLDPIIPGDSRLFPPPAVSTRIKQTKQHAVVPDASDANATLKYWDDYRKQERQRLDDLGLRDQVVEAFSGPPGEERSIGHLLPGDLARKHLTIGEFPSFEPVHLEDQAQEEYRRDEFYVRMLFERGLISPWEYRWRRLRRSLLRLTRGILKRNAHSGVRSAHPTRGTGKTESE